MTAAEPLPDVRCATGDPEVEEVLTVGEGGAAVMLIIGDRGRTQVYQYRRAGLVVAEAPNLRALADIIAAEAG